LSTKSFADLGVIEPILKRLARKGIEKPFPIQTMTIADAIEGRDILGKAKTGSGKTLAFGIPLVQRMKAGTQGTQALVLVPTRELCAQVAEELRDISPRSARIVATYGGVGMGENLQQAPNAHIVVATPGRLTDLVKRKAADLSNVHMLVIDEADRMADMGFLPQVQWILARLPRERQTMLFSATLDNEIMGLIAQTRDAVRHEIAEAAPTVESVEHHLFEVHRMDKFDVLISLLDAPRNLTLIFTRTKRGCDKLAKQLRDAGVKAAAIHGDLRQGAREQALDRFEKGKVDVLVATDVAARGLDIDGITQVVNYDPPEDHKAYIHRVGRTARAGRAGVGITLALYDQREDVERMARRLRLHPHIVEVFSSDPRLRKVGTEEMPGTARVSATSGAEEPAKARSAVAALSRKARPGGRRPGQRRR
jgi:superfamily II DNA/RNA helicase